MYDKKTIDMTIEKVPEVFVIIARERMFENKNRILLNK